MHLVVGLEFDQLGHRVGLVGQESQWSRSTGKLTAGEGPQNGSSTSLNLTFLRGFARGSLGRFSRSHFTSATSKA